MKIRLLQSRTRAQKGTWKSAKCDNYSDPPDAAETMQTLLGGHLLPEGGRVERA